MKKFFYIGVLLLLAGCQNELYKNPLEEFKGEQGVYIVNKGILQLFVEEGKDTKLDGLKVGLAAKENRAIDVKMEVGNQAQLDAYNAKHATNYVLLPKEMYEAEQKLTFSPQFTTMTLPIVLKNVKFSMKGNYALPIKIQGGDVNLIPGEEETLVVLEQRINTKSLRFKGSGSEKATMFPDNFTVDQWTMEIMVNRKAYTANNRAVCGTKLVSGSSASDEIYTRFGDVTINPNQLQIKTGSSQIDVAADKFSAQPNTWYMLTFVYDGKKNYIYVNGKPVAEREIRTGAYGLVGFWISGANELVREVRFWKTARTPQEIAANVWKMVNPDDENLLLYYPMNGKKRDSATGKVTDDESIVWDWSKNAKHLPFPSNGTFDDNAGNGFVFPPESK